MARAVPERELMPGLGGVRFDVAQKADDADIRRLLRENPMQGRIALSLERDPDYFKDACLPGETKLTIVAREKGRLVCVGACATRQRFVNGAVRRVGYLQGLRLDSTCAGRFDIVKRGYRFFQELQASAPADMYFTSIATDNLRARQLLEAGLSGMPCYEFLGEFVTLVLPVGRWSSNRSNDSASPDSVAPAPPLEELADYLNENNAAYQFAPCSGADELAALECLGLTLKDFHFVRRGGRIKGCAALWDQRAFKQWVIRGYRPGLRRARPLLNLAARLYGGLQLPPVGTTLAQALVSHVAGDADDTDSLVEAIDQLGIAAMRGKIKFLALGFAANDPRLAVARRKFPCREYRSRLYAVRWEEMGGSAADLDPRVLQPELALL